MVVVGFDGLQLLAATPAARVATTAMDFVEGILRCTETKEVRKERNGDQSGEIQI